MRSLSLLLSLAACATPPPANVVGVTVLAEKQPCEGEGAFLCLRVERDGGAPESFYDGIEGWEHQWGVESDIRVDEQPVEDPPDDGSAFTWTHLATLRTTRRVPGDAFSWGVSTGLDRFLEVTGDTEGVLLDGKAFSCVDAGVCAELDGLARGGGEAEVAFQYGDPMEGPLVVVGAAH